MEEVSFNGILTSIDSLGKKNPHSSSLIRWRSTARKTTSASQKLSGWQTQKKMWDWEVLPHVTLRQHMLEAKEGSRWDMILWSYDTKTQRAKQDCVLGRLAWSFHTGTLQLSHITTENNPFSLQAVADFAPHSAALIAIKLNAVLRLKWAITWSRDFPIIPQTALMNQTQQDLPSLYHCFA